MNAHIIDTFIVNHYDFISDFLVRIH